MTHLLNRMAVIGTVIGAGFLAAPAAAFEPSNDAERLMVEWLEANSCAMTQDEFMEKAMSGPGVSGVDLMKARRGMTKSGVIRKGPENSMTLTAGEVCGGAEVAAPTYDSGSETDKLIGQLIAVFENNGCILSERQAKTLAEDVGMTREQVDIAGEALDDDGAFLDTDAGLQLTLGKCADFKAAAPEGDDKTRVMAMFEQNDCALTEDQLPDVAQQFQVTRKQFRPIAQVMEDAGELVERGDMITLTAGPICGNGGAGSESASSDTDLRATVMSMFEQNDCTATEDSFTALVDGLGLDNDATYALEGQIDTMMEAGEITYDEKADLARLTVGDKCGK